MKIEIDHEASALYIYFQDKEKAKNLRSVPVDENIVIDYTEDNKLAGIEIMSLKLFD